MKSMIEVSLSEMLQSYPVKHTLNEKHDRGLTVKNVTVTLNEKHDRYLTVKNVTFVHRKHTLNEKHDRYLTVKNVTVVPRETYPE